MDRRFQLEGTPRTDGKVLITSADLPGFRLLLAEDPDPTAYHAPVQEALSVFLPLFLAAEARQANIHLHHGASHPRGMFQIQATVVSP